jgi:hypothetical protein
MVDKKDKNLIGAAGEHLVLSRLLSEGILAAQAPRGARKADVLVNHLDGKAPCLIQVKTRKGLDADSGWHMGEKHEEIKDEDLYYCFVALDEGNSLVYIIPATKVSEVVEDSHRTWLDTPGAKGQKHNETKMRFIKNRYGALSVKSAPDGWMDEYLEAWDPITS